MSQKPVITINHYLEGDKSFWIAWLLRPNIGTRSKTLVASARGETPSDAMTRLCSKWPMFLSKQQG